MATFNTLLSLYPIVYTVPQLERLPGPTGGLFVGAFAQADESGRPAFCAIIEKQRGRFANKTMVKKWSAKVGQKSNVLDLEAGVFTWDDSARIALSLKRSSEMSHRRKAPPFQSAMSMLNSWQAAQRLERTWFSG